MADSELHARALKAIKAQDSQDEEQMLLRLAETTAGSRSLTDLTATLAAARCGQIDTLFIAEAKAAGSHEELVNLIALQTIRHGGRISILRSVALPGENPLAATLRYELPQIA